MLGLVGGPIGALVLGLAAIVTQLISTKEEASQTGDAIARAMQQGADAANAEAARRLSDRKVSAFRRCLWLLGHWQERNRDGAYRWRGL